MADCIMYCNSCMYFLGIAAISSPLSDLYLLGYNYLLIKLDIICLNNLKFMGNQQLFVGKA